VEAVAFGLLVVAHVAVTVGVDVGAYVVMVDRAAGRRSRARSASASLRRRPRTVLAARIPIRRTTDSPRQLFGRLYAEFSAKYSC
jgi:hypothetical protein